MFACQQNGHLVPGKMKICYIIENLASIKTRIHRKMIKGLHDIFRFFCFTLGKNFIPFKPSHLPSYSYIFESPAEPPEISCTFSYTQHGVVLTEISGILVSACVFVRVPVCQFVGDIFSKLHLWIIHGKIAGTYFSPELSPLVHLPPYEKIRM